MLQRVSIDGIEMPRLYIAENNDDVELARRSGIPYVKWKWGQEELVRMLLRPALEKMFPYIKWSEVLGRRRPVRSKVIICKGNIDDDMHVYDEAYDADAMLASQLEYDKKVDLLDHNNPQSINDDGEAERIVPIAESKRDCCGDVELGYDVFVEDSLSIEDYVGDLSSHVDIDALQKLGMLPKFLGDTADCIKRNLSQSMRWTEGYTKKLGVTLGNFNRKPSLPNLVIIDISASIPDGIAATMITLADTLRSQCNAELIITSARSGYYPIGAELPKPQTIRDYYGRSNESQEFWGIIDKHIAGREFGHVISFGDNDSPGNGARHWNRVNGKIEFKKVSLIGTKVHEVHHYHTWMENTATGYAEWVHKCSPNVVIHYDTSWCKVMK